MTNPAIKPYVSASVVYGFQGPSGVEPCAAIITYVQDREQGLVDLAMFPPSGGYTPSFAVPWASELTAGHWSYAKRA